MKTETGTIGTLQTWTVDEVEAAWDANKITLIDVRTPQEYMLEHIESVALMPMASFDPAKLPAQQGKPVVFYCGSGARSGRVAQAVLAAGVPQIAHMEGGFAAWKKAGKPYLGTDMSTGAPKRMQSGG